MIAIYIVVQSLQGNVQKIVLTSLLPPQAHDYRVLLLGGWVCHMCR